MASNKQPRLRVEQSHASHYRVALVDISNRRQDRNARSGQTEKDAGKQGTLVKDETTFTHKVPKHLDHSGRPSMPLSSPAHSAAAALLRW